MKQSFDKYIGIVGVDEFPVYARRAIDQWYNYVTRVNLEWKWRQNYSMFFRCDEKSSGWTTLQRFYPRHDFIPLNVNEAKSIVKTVCSFLQKPTFRGRSSNTDPEVADKIEIYNAQLEYDKENGFLSKNDEAAKLAAYLMNTSFSLVEWDQFEGDHIELADAVISTGEVTDDLLTVLDWYFDPTIKSDQDLLWGIARQKVNKFKLAAQYPEHADKILGKTINSVISVPYLFDLDATQTDDIFVYKFIHRVEPQLCPKGRYTIFLDDVVLSDKPNKYKRINVFPLRPSQHVYGIYGDTDANDLFPVQKLHDAMTSCLMTKVTAFGIPKVFVERGLISDQESLIGGLKVFNINSGTSKPTTADLMGNLQNDMAPMPMIERWMQTVTGVNSASMGQPDPGIKAAVTMSFMQSMAQRYSSAFQQGYLNYLKDKAEFALELRKNYATTERLVKIVGKDKKYKVARWKASDLTPIDSVYVEPVDPVTNSIGGRIMFAEKLASMGASKREYERAIKTGSYDPIIDDGADEMNLIEMENAAIAEGKVPPAFDDDEHPLHRFHHRKPMQDIDGRLNENAFRAYNEHLRLHDEAELRKIERQARMEATAMIVKQKVMAESGMAPPPGAAMNGPPGNPARPMGAPPPSQQDNNKQPEPQRVSRERIKNAVGDMPMGAG